ncbi:MAG: GHMP kinase, partial [bacterium]|nr:GHMP kinase [bacterium]
SAALGKLLTEEHSILRDILGTSTKKIDRMVEAAMDEGAYGAKINGSGGGGCMFATAAGKDADGVAEALRRAGGRVWRVKADIGVAVEN